MSLTDIFNLLFSDRVVDSLVDSLETRWGMGAEKEEPVIMDSTIEEKLIKIRDAGAILGRRAQEADRQIKLIQDYLTNECITVDACVHCPKGTLTLGFGKLDDPTSHAGRDRRKVWKLWADTSLTNENMEALLLCNPRTRIRAIEFLPDLLDAILLNIEEESK